MSDPCTETPRLERMESKLDTMAKVLTQLAVQDNEINHLKDAVKHIPELVAWKERWGGVTIALGFIGSLAGVLAIVKGW